MNEPVSTPKRGVLDFLNMIYDGHPEYSLIAVKAPFEETLRTFIQFCEGQATKERFSFETLKTQDMKSKIRQVRRVENISIRLQNEEGEHLAFALLVLQVRECEWTIILRSLFDVRDEVFDVPREAEKLSELLQTRSVTLLEEDTSGAIEYEIFENGESVEYFSEAGYDDVRFESKLREKPAIVLELEEADDNDLEEDDFDRDYKVDDEKRVKFVNEWFSELGIYIPACYPVTDDGEPMLAVDLASENTIDRADWIEVKYTLEV